MKFWLLYYSFFKIGVISFGGGYAMIPLMRGELIEHREWITLSRFLDIVAISEMTPGPISVNMATFIGYQTLGIGGSVLATAGVLSPSLLILYGVMRFWRKRVTSPEKQGSRLSLGETLLKGLRPAVISLIALAALYLGEGALEDLFGVLVFLAGLLLALKTRLNPLTILALAGSFSLAAGRVV